MPAPGGAGALSKARPPERRVSRFYAGRGRRQPGESSMTKIMPCLWFDDRIDEAVDFYTATFKDARILSRVRQNAANPW